MKKQLSHNHATLLSRIEGWSRMRPVWVRVLLGAASGLFSYVISITMQPQHRSPYLVAYPLVVLSAWTLGLPGAIASAVASGVLLERYLFFTRQVNLMPTPSNWITREVIFIGGSILVGILTRSAAQHQQELQTAQLQDQLARIEAEQAVLEERKRVEVLAGENEGRLRLALDGANVGLWEWDLDSRQSKWSDGFFTLHGLDPAMNTPGYDMWHDAVHPDDRERVDADLARALEEAGTFAAEYRILTPTGETRWVTCEGTCVVHEGKVQRMVGYAGDVTRRKQADLALLQTEKLAVAGRLAASIAHEINNPLEAAINLIYLGTTTHEEHHRQDFLDEAVRQLQRVFQIATQTLKFSRTANRASVCKASDLLRSTIDLLRPKLMLAGVELIEEVRSDPEFLCHSGELQQVMTNIINNAVEAMPGPGRIHVRISSAVSPRIGLGGVRITIADNGVGIPESVLPRIREPFFTTKDGSGTGLGLWVVAELIQRHRGTLAIRSSTHGERHGTAMSIFLPGDLTASELEEHPSSLVGVSLP